MSARGPAIIRNINRFDVLQTIRLHDNQISRSELSDLTGLSQATISSIVGHLIEEGALIEDDAYGLGARGRGRPLVMLRLNPGIHACCRRQDRDSSDRFFGHRFCRKRWRFRQHPGGTAKVESCPVGCIYRSRCPRLPEEGEQKHRGCKWDWRRAAGIHRFSPRYRILESGL